MNTWPYLPIMNGKSVRIRKSTDLLNMPGSDRQKATLADIDYSATRTLDKNMFQRLATLDFIKRNENVIITGLTGVGKSFLAQAFITSHKCYQQTRQNDTTTSVLLC